MTTTKAAPQQRRLIAWRRRLAGRRRLRDLDVPIPGAGRAYVMAVPADPDAVLDETAAVAKGEGDEGHMPYWATPWASGLGLAEVVLAHPTAVRRRRVLELGCGLGTTATATLEAQAGAGSLVAADCFAETLVYCRYNCLRNSGRAPATLLADWRTPGGQAILVRHGPFDLVLAADVLYEPEDVAPLLELLPRLAGGGAFWLAEPGRETSGRFVAAARLNGWGDEDATIRMEREWPAGAGPARVGVHRFSPGPA